MYYHGTSSALNITKVILPPIKTNIKREYWRERLTDKVFITNSIKSAKMYAKKACEKYGGNPIIYKVKPFGLLTQLHNAEFICDGAKIIHNN